jgi:hypothetical protein
LDERGGQAWGEAEGADDHVPGGYGERVVAGEERFLDDVAEAAQKAAARMSSAPRLSSKPSPSPNAIRPMPAKESAVPSQARRLRRSCRKIMARTGGDDRRDVDDEAGGAGGDRQLADVEQQRVGGDEEDAAVSEAPELAARREFGRVTRR